MDQPSSARVQRDQTDASWLRVVCSVRCWLGESTEGKMDASMSENNRTATRHSSDRRRRHSHAHGQAASSLACRALNLSRRHPPQAMARAARGVLRVRPIRVATVPYSPPSTHPPLLSALHQSAGHPHAERTRRHGHWASDRTGSVEMRRDRCGPLLPPASHHAQNGFCP